MEKIISIDLVGSEAVSYPEGFEIIDVLEEIETHGIEYIGSVVSSLKDIKDLKVLRNKIVDTVEEISSIYAGRTTELYYDFKKPGSKNGVIVGCCIPEMYCFPGIQEVHVILGHYSANSREMRKDSIREVMSKVRSYFKKDRNTHNECDKDL